MRLVGLDVLRGIAIALVMLRHAWPSVFGGAGIVGVVIFFTLSGYLITGVLMRDLDNVDRIRFGVFYRNRVFRLVPALLFVTGGGVLVVATWWNLSGDRGLVVQTTLVALTYTADIPGLHFSSAFAPLDPFCRRTVLPRLASYTPDWFSLQIPRLGHHRSRGFA
jgi:peptidoglycan/LPS O-acetylase OafA/YrhL